MHVLSANYIKQGGKLNMDDTKKTNLSLYQMACRIAKRSDNKIYKKDINLLKLMSFFHIRLYYLFLDTIYQLVCNNT